MIWLLLFLPFLSILIITLFLHFILPILLLLLFQPLLRIYLPHPPQRLQGLNPETPINILQEHPLVLRRPLDEAEHLLGEVDDVLVVGEDFCLEVLHELVFVDLAGGGLL